MRDKNIISFFFFNDTATTEIYTLSLHDALPISIGSNGWAIGPSRSTSGNSLLLANPHLAWGGEQTFYEAHLRSEEHTSELQSRQYLVCRLLLEKKKTSTHPYSLFTIMFYYNLDL